MRYEVGDRVLVRDDLTCGEYYYNEGTENRMDATREMAELSGTVVTISEIDYFWCDSPFYHVEELSDMFFWSDGMFVSLAEEDDIQKSSMNIKQFLVDR